MPNPAQFLAALNLPLTAPILPLLQALGATAPVAQAGVLAPKNTAINTPFSGVFGTVQSVPTPAVQGQLWNFSPYAIKVASDPNGDGAFTVLPGQPFNFGPIDLSMLYFASAGTLNQEEVHVYWEG